MVTKQLFNAALAQARQRCEREGQPIHVYVGRRGDAGDPWAAFVRSSAEGRPEAPARAAWVATVRPDEDGGTRTQWSGILNECVEA